MNIQSIPPSHVDDSPVLSSGTTDVASDLWEAVGSWQPSTCLPGSCCHKNFSATSHPGVLTGSSLYVCCTHGWLGGQILGHCTAAYVSSFTHPWRLGGSFWLWMHEIPFLLQACLTHVECVQYTLSESFCLLFCWLLEAELKGAEDDDKDTFLCLVYQGVTDTSWLTSVSPGSFLLKSWPTGQQPSLNWELAGNADSQLPPRTAESKPAF